MNKKLFNKFRKEISVERIGMTFIQWEKINDKWIQMGFINESRRIDKVIAQGIVVDDNERMSTDYEFSIEVKLNDSVLSEIENHFEEICQPNNPLNYGIRGFVIEVLIDEIKKWKGLSIEPNESGEFAIGCSANKLIELSLSKYKTSNPEKLNELEKIMLKMGIDI